MQYMKWIFLSIAGVCTMYAAKAQENTAKAQEFTLSGKVGHYSAPAKVYLLYLLAGAEAVDRDSATMKDGSFVFKGSISLEAPINAVYLAFAKAHPDHLMSLFCIQQYGGPVPQLDMVEPLFRSLSAEVRAT